MLSRQVFRIVGVVVVVGAAQVVAAASTASTVLMVPRAPSAPAGSSAVKRLVSRRRGTVAVAVENLSVRRGAGEYQEWTVHGGDRFQTASIVKADILETLLHHYGGPLTGSTAETASGMIEDSDNDDATDLWDLAGGASGIAAYNEVAGLRHTSLNAAGYWGETLTTAPDQVRLLARLALPSDVLTPAARRYQLGLMGDIDPGQDWGVTGGVPDRVTVALKNGWVPLASYTDWEVNSIGWVHGEGRDYLIAVLTANDPSEQYGVNTIDGISSLVFRELRPGAT